MSGLSISIVIPCYKQAHWLAEAIESALTPCGGGCEIIVVDDGSPDNVAEVVSTFPAVHLIEQANQGLSAARNAGLSRSRGDYVVFLDSDDRLVEGWLEAAVDHLNSRPELAFVSGRVGLISAKGSRLDTPEQRTVLENHYRELLHDNFIWTPGCVVYRRSALDVVGTFDLRLRGTQDFDLNLRIARQCPIQCLDRRALDYRIHGTGLSGQAAIMFAESMEILRRQEPYVLGRADLVAARRHGEAMIRQVYGNAMADQVFSDLKSGEWLRALRRTAILARAYPTGLAKGLIKRVGRRLKLPQQAMPPRA